MHRVVQSHLQDFASQYGLELEQSKLFEAFTNYTSFRIFCADSVDPRDLVYEGDDPGIDGVMIFLDDAYMSTVEEVDEFFKNKRRDADAVIIFVQAKTSESWAKSEINVFQSAVQDFLSSKNQYPVHEYFNNARDVFDSVIKNVGKLRNGKPNVCCYFANTARSTTDREIIAAKNAFNNALEDTGLFSQCLVELLDRDRVIGLWTAAQ